MKCREELCRGKVPKGKGVESLSARLMGLCLYCYRMRFGPRSHGKVNTSMLNSAQIRERFIRFHREPAKRFYAPAFYKEWLEYWKTWWRG